jgi:hypothetical protein
MVKIESPLMIKRHLVFRKIKTAEIFVRMIAQVPLPFNDPYAWNIGCVVKVAVAGGLDVHWAFIKLIIHSTIVRKFTRM